MLQRRSSSSGSPKRGPGLVEDVPNGIGQPFDLRLDDGQLLEQPAVFRAGAVDISLSRDEVEGVPILCASRAATAARRSASRCGPVPAGGKQLLVHPFELQIGGWLWR